MSEAPDRPTSQEARAARRMALRGIKLAANRMSTDADFISERLRRWLALYDAARNVDPDAISYLLSPAALNEFRADEPVGASGASS